MSQELGKDAIEEIEALSAWEWTPAEIALAIMETAFPQGVERESKLIVRCWPWEKAAIVRAAYPNKVEDFIRQTLIEKARTTEIVPNPNRRRDP